MKKLNSKQKAVIGFVILFIAMFAMGKFIGGLLFGSGSESIASQEAKGEIINVLFMGIDARDAKSNSRSDTMILASIDTKTKRIAMLSIPRDTRVKTAFGRSEKINAINYTKGPEEACKVVGKLLNTEVDFYVVTNFAGFGKIVDTLGGVDLEVETNMVHQDVSYSINLAKGYQHLNGDKALQYVRYRGGPTADIGRTQRQQKFIKALAQQMFKAKTIFKLPQLLPQISDNVNTNIPMTDMIALAKMAQKIDTGKITSQTLPGYPYTDPSSGASYWEADNNTAKIIIKSLLQGKTFPVVGDPPSWISKEQEKYAPVDLPGPETLEEEDKTPTEVIHPDGEGIETLPGSSENGNEGGVINPGTAEPGNPDNSTTQPPDEDALEELPPGDGYEGGTSDSRTYNYNGQ